jgi:glycosyltransferase involved in cell wall biosynthesis
MKKKKNYKGLVLIPAFNEEESISRVVRKACAYLSVLVVDDGSQDRTVQQAKSAGAEVISNARNMGKGASLQAGIQHALAQGVEYVITLDADGQHDPQEIPAFIEAYEDHQSDLIIGRRDFTQMPVVRRASNTLGTSLFSWAVGRTIHDNQSGYRLIGQRLMKVLHASRESGFEFEVEMIVTCIQRRFRLDWVPIRTIYAGEKSHIKPLQHTRKFVGVCLRARRLIKKDPIFKILFPHFGQVK